MFGCWREIEKEQLTPAAIGGVPAAARIRASERPRIERSACPDASTKSSTGVLSRRLVLPKEQADTARFSIGFVDVWPTKSEGLR
jgi:hypothetical protein